LLTEVELDQALLPSSFLPLPLSLPPFSSYWKKKEKEKEKEKERKKKRNRNENTSCFNLATAESSASYLWPLCGPLSWMHAKHTGSL
jgi:hypothetical protein